MPYCFLLAFSKFLILRNVVRALYIPLADGAFFTVGAWIVPVVAIYFSLLSVAAKGGFSLGNIPAEYFFIYVRR